MCVGRIKGIENKHAATDSITQTLAGEKQYAANRRRKRKEQNE
jgi:hypothetical protein